MGDLTSYIVSGLDAEYLPITCQINEKVGITWQELYATLITFENTLINLNVVNQPTETGNMTANIAYNRQNTLSQGNNKNQFNKGQGRGYINKNLRGNYKPKGRGGRGGNIRTNNSKPICQLCGKIGHVAGNCWHRFDEEFSPASHNQEFGNKGSAYIATPDVVADPNWLADSGASNRITPDIRNLKIHTKYQGNYSIYVGNGSKLSIDNIGHNICLTKHVPLHL